MQASAADLNAVWMEVTDIDEYDGASGTWVTRLNVTAGNKSDCCQKYRYTDSQRYVSPFDRGIYNPREFSMYKAGQALLGSVLNPV